MAKGLAHLKWSTADNLEAYYDSYNSVVHPYQTGAYANNEGDNFSFGLNNILYFYIDMHVIQGKSRWLDLIIDTCNHILDQTDAKRSDRGEITITPLQDPYVAGNYYQAPFPLARDGIPSQGWSSFDGSGSYLRNQVLQDGQIIGAMATVCDYFESNGINGYDAVISAMWAHIKVVIDQHLPSSRTDKVKDGYIVPWSMYYPERTTGADSVFSSPVAYNHCGGYLKACALYHKHFNEPSFIPYIEGFMQFLRETRTEVGNGYNFRYLYTGTNAEDLNHLSYTLPFIKECLDQGLAEVTETEVRRYANTVVATWRKEDIGNADERVDGTSADEIQGLPQGEKSNVGQMAYLGYLNPEIYKMGRDLTATAVINNYHSMYYGLSSLIRYASGNITL